VTVAPEPGGAPWWKRATLHPSGAQVRGLPLARIESSWCAADELGAEAFGDRLAGAGAASPLRDLRFALEAPLEGSARLQTAVLGAYRRCSGEQGLFVLIVEPRADRPRFRYLLEAPDPGTALAGLRFDAARRQLVVHWCGLACDTESRIAWDERTGRYVRVDGEGPVRLQ
jgi:hypothetical protein